MDDKQIESLIDEIMAPMDGDEELTANEREELKRAHAEISAKVRQEAKEYDAKIARFSERMYTSPSWLAKLRGYVSKAKLLWRYRGDRDTLINIGLVKAKV